MATARERSEHGVTAYRLGCRCDACVEALRGTARIWHFDRRVRAGAEPATRVNVDDVREHIEFLKAADMTQDDIARRAGLSASTLSRLMKPTTRRASRITARKILGVRP